MKSVKKLFAGIMAAALCVTTMGPVYANGTAGGIYQDEEYGI